MIKRSPWSVSAALLLSFLVLIFGGVSTGENARQDDEQEDEEERSGHDEEARSITDDLDCDACHTQTSFKMVSKRGKAGGYDHDQTGFPLEGRHRDLGCVECHTPGRTVSGECVGCHTDQHRGGLGGDCDRCHTPMGWKIINALEIHERTALPLTGRHAMADCTECHLRNGTRQFTGVPSDCYACHEADYRRSDVHPVHTGSATTPPFPRDCAQCHRPTGFSPAIINPAEFPSRDALTTAADHDARFPLSFGPHRGAPCDSCHVSTSVRRAVQCTGCHSHNPARLRSIHGAKLVSFDGSSCLTCHRDGSVP